MNATDPGLWQQVLHFLGLSQLDQTALLLSLGAALFLPLGVEHSIPESQRPKWLWLASLIGANVVALVIALCFATEWRHGLGIGVFSGSVCHFARYALAMVPGFKWMRAKPKVELVYDGAGNVRGAHVDGFDDTVLITRPGEPTQPKE